MAAILRASPKLTAHVTVRQFYPAHPSIAREVAEPGIAP
jgi:hypothetical protein